RGGTMPNLTTRRRMRTAAVAAGAAALATALIAAPAGAAPSRSGSDHARTTLPKQIVPAKGSQASPRATGKKARPARAASSNGIDYHGGPVLLGTTNVYLIWYGDWTKDPAAQPILTDLVSNIGGSPYFNINTTYYNGSNQF